MDWMLDSGSSRITSLSPRRLPSQRHCFVPTAYSGVENRDGGRPEQDYVQETDARITTITQRIEDILEYVVDALGEGRPLSIPLRSRGTGNEVAALFPSASKSGARRFSRLFLTRSFYMANAVLDRLMCVASLLQILYHCHEALASGVVITKRFVHNQPAICDQVSLVVRSDSQSSATDWKLKIHLLPESRFIRQSEIC